MRSAVVVVALFAVATAVALVARRWKLPYTVALVIAGLALGSAQLFEAPHLTKDLLYTVFLPGLLYEAAFHLEFRRFLQNKIAILSLAIPGVIVAIVIMASILVPVINASGIAVRALPSAEAPDVFTLTSGLVFAAVIAATDPIAVMALFKSVGAPKRLAVLVEGESLLNDGTSAVFFSLVLGFATGETTTIAAASLGFLRVVGVGILIGAAIGYAISFIIHKVDDPMIEITLTTIAAYGSFVAAESFHFSGVMATVTAGMLGGNYAARTGMSASTRVAVTSFWEYLAFALNSLVFLLIGFEVKLESLLHVWAPILVAYVVVTLTRAVIALLVAAALHRTREKIPRAWIAVLTWGGLRGALSMVLVLGLPPEVAHRELIVSMTFGVVILSILTQGLTMAPLLRRLGLLTQASQSRAERDRLRGLLKGARAALAEIHHLGARHGYSEQALNDVRADYNERILQTEAALASLHAKSEEILDEERVLVRRQALVAEKDALFEAHRSGEIGESSFESLLADVDARLFDLDEGRDSSSTATANVPRSPRAQ